MTAGVILSAGESSRMGTPKALLKIKGTTFLEYIKNSLLEAGASPVLIVLGHTPDLILNAVDTGSAVVLTNPDYKMGQLTSIQTAVRFLEGENADGILRCIFGVRISKIHPIEKPMIASSIPENILMGFFMRSITTAINIAPLAAPAMKDATRSPIHENTCPYID